MEMNIKIWLESLTVLHSFSFASSACSYIFPEVYKQNDGSCLFCLIPYHCEFYFFHLNLNSNLNWDARQSWILVRMAWPHQHAVFFSYVPRYGFWAGFIFILKEKSVPYIIGLHYSSTCRELWDVLLLTCCTPKGQPLLQTPVSSKQPTLITAMTLIIRVMSKSELKYWSRLYGFHLRLSYGTLIFHSTSFRNYIAKHIQVVFGT